MATKQAKKRAEDNRRRKPSPINGQVLPAGFEAHPERRHNGAWKKEDTARYKLEQMMKMSAEELNAVIRDADSPVFERQLATLIFKGEWTEISGMMNQVYGMPRQEVQQTNIELKPILPKPKKEKK